MALNPRLCRSLRFGVPIIITAATALTNFNVAANEYAWQESLGDSLFTLSPWITWAVTLGVILYLEEKSEVRVTGINILSSLAIRTFIGLILLTSYLLWIGDLSDDLGVAGESILPQSQFIFLILSFIVFIVAKISSYLNKRNTH